MTCFTQLAINPNQINCDLFRTLEEKPFLMPCFSQLATAFYAATYLHSPDGKVERALLCFNICLDICQNHLNVYAMRN